MGQKVNPVGFRTAVHKQWKSRWYADKKHFGEMLNGDVVIRDMVAKRLKEAAVADIVIERSSNRARVTVYTARPGVVIGRKGEGIDKLREDLSAATGKEIYVDIKEVRDADVNAQLVAENIAQQLERRISFRRAMKRALQLAMDMGALGIRVQACGRLGGAELARTEHFMVGKVPLQTLRADVQYGFAEANTMAGAVGVKCWICRSGEEKTAEQASGKEKRYASHA
ncbi:MAG: 30S ribosomal protein S3 [Kiritimatiellae bacterium]|nr:30S ribosomal protein S3 [Kiritimatiellia bacterium]